MVPLARRRRGIGIVEISFVALAMSILAVAAVASSSHGGQGGAADARIVRAILADARALAATSGNGATVSFSVPASNGYSRGGGFQARVYPGRPNAAGVGAPGLPQRGPSSVTDAGGAVFSVFFSSAGSASVADGWTPDAGAFPGAAEPACASGIEIQVHAPGEPVGSAPAPDRILTIDCETGDVSIPRRY